MCWRQVAAAPLIRKNVRRLERMKVMSADGIRLFISHSSEDAAFVDLLIQLLRTALNLPAAAIRCTSVDGYRLPGGVDTNEQLRREVHEAEAFVGVVSERSLRSLYVLFELGARWGARRHLLPLLPPGASTEILGGPLAGINALRADSSSQLYQLVSDIAVELGEKAETPASYERFVQQIVEFRPNSAADDAEGAVPQPLGQRSDVFARLEKEMPELLAEMKDDLRQYPYAREFVLLRKAWLYNADPDKITLSYYFDDHPYLRNKVQILENHGLVTETTYNNVERFVILEPLAEYLALVPSASGTNA